MQQGMAPLDAVRTDAMSDDGSRLCGASAIHFDVHRLTGQARDSEH
ncbi:hypothetical protein FM112_02275 [Gulosibacter sp. 10]|nr:hypothetical protein FM112_02275 [Gulosibacter sp. 10]